MAVQQVRLRLHNLLAYGLHDLFGDELQNHGLQGKGGRVCAALDLSAPDQGFEGDQHVARWHGGAKPGHERIERHQFTLDGEPVDSPTGSLVRAAIG